MAAYPIAQTVIEHQAPFITNDIVDEKLLKRTERIMNQVTPLDVTRLMINHDPDELLLKHSKDAKRALIAALNLLAEIQKRWKEEEAKTHLYRKKPTTKRRF
jgi:DNA primase